MTDSELIINIIQASVTESIARYQRNRRSMVCVPLLVLVPRYSVLFWMAQPVTLQIQTMPSAAIVHASAAAPQVNREVVGLNMIEDMVMT